VRADSPDLVDGKRLIDLAKRQGFVFGRIAPGPDGPLLGVRDTDRWRDEIYLAGFSDSCSAIRRRKSTLIVPGGPPVTERIAGGALEVLDTVARWRT
jgi:hypothetical protein